MSDINVFTNRVVAHGHTVFVSQPRADLAVVAIPENAEAPAAELNLKAVAINGQWYSVSNAAVLRNPKSAEKVFNLDKEGHPPYVAFAGTNSRGVWLSVTEPRIPEASESAKALVSEYFNGKSESDEGEVESEVDNVPF